MAVIQEVKPLSALCELFQTLHKADTQAVCNETRTKPCGRVTVLSPYHHNAGCIAPASKKDGGSGADSVSKAMAAGR